MNFLNTLSNNFVLPRRLLLGAQLFLGALALPSTSFAVTHWIDCTTGPGAECRFPVEELNASQVRVAEATIRYGTQGQYSYRRSQIFVFPGSDKSTYHSIDCGPDEFGDPLPNKRKKCSYTYEPFKGSYDSQVLHSIKDSEFDPSDLDQVRARSQFIDNLLYSENEQYQLRLTHDGQWGVWEGFDLIAEIIPKDPQATQRHQYRVTLTDQGLVLYRNNEVIWDLYSGGSGHFALILGNDGTPMLVDMKERRARMTFFRSFDGNHRWRDSRNPVPDRVMVQILSESGFTHHEDWTNSQHADFAKLHQNSRQSIWHWHNSFDKLEQKVKTYGQKVGNEVLKDFDSVKHFIGKKINPSSIEHWVKHASSKLKFVEAIENIIQDSFSKKGLVEAFASEINAALKEQGVYQQKELLDQVNEAQANAKIFTGRKLDVNQPVEGTVDCKGICKFLSSSANKSMRIDYALEAAPTFLGKAFFGNGAVGTVRALNQLQVRAFFTHPRIRNNRYYTEIRIRFQDFSGGGVFSPETNTFVSADVVAGTIAIHDLILPYSWGKGESFFKNARFEGAKWLAGTGLAIEADAEFPGLQVNLKQIVGASANVVRGVGALSAAGGAMMSFADINQALSLSRTVDGQSLNIERLSKIAEHVVIRQPSIEAGAGVIGGTLYDINEISELVYRRLPKSTKHALTVGTIALVETFGGLAGVALGTLTGANEAVAEDASLLVTAVNTEFLAGSWIADLAMWGLFRVSYGRDNKFIRTYGISTAWLTYRHNFEIEEWQPFRDAMSRFYPATAPQLKAPVRFRVQWNWDFYTREW